MRKILLALLLLLAPTACAPPLVWGKPGVDASTATQEARDCRRVARATAMRQYSRPPPEPFAGSTGPSPYAGMRAGSTNMWQSSTSDMGPYGLEERIIDACMRQRGYDRVPLQMGA